MDNCISIGNKLRRRPLFQCGRDANTLLIGSVGTSKRDDSLDVEIKKTNKAVRLGVNAVTDHSFYGDIERYHKALIENTDAYISTVANYELAANCREKNIKLKDVSDEEIIDLFYEQASRGMDIITVHASFLKKHIFLSSQSDRIIPTTSKGGGIISDYIRSTGKENPYYTHFNKILDICSEFNVTISLGTVFRPATICDTFDTLLLDELEIMGKLVIMARQKGVPIMIEGIGHSTIGNIETHIKLARVLCHDAPYRMLPMATDTALGYDHISSAIAASVGVHHGASAILCVSRSEHIGLPSEEDLEEAIIAGKIAVHCGLISRQNADLTKDLQMSITRWRNGCKGDWTTAIHPDGAKRALDLHGRLDDQLIQCSMCGSYCGIAAGISTTKNRVKNAQDEFIKIVSD